jgi:hypothetical protein
MKRTVVFYLIALPLIFSCHFKSKNLNSENFYVNGSTGKFFGAFIGDSGVTVYIYHTTTDSISGDLWAKNSNFKKNFTALKDGEKYSVQISAPSIGNEVSGHFDSGYFDLSINAEDTDQMNITWNPGKSSGLPEKAYSLNRKLFAYSADVGDYPQASQRLLIDSDVNNLYKDTLEEMRNEIFARHGYCFENSYWQNDFEYTDWYVPNSIDVIKDLTDIEKKNITLIKKYEKTAKEDEDFNRQ